MDQEMSTGKMGFSRSLEACKQNSYSVRWRMVITGSRCGTAHCGTNSRTNIMASYLPTSKEWRAEFSTRAFGRWFRSWATEGFKWMAESLKVIQPNDKDWLLAIRYTNILHSFHWSQEWKLMMIHASILVKWSIVNQAAVQQSAWMTGPTWLNK